jgi:hypothetical protein
MNTQAIKQSLLELDVLVSKIGSNYERDYKDWSQILKTSQNDFDIGESHPMSETHPKGESALTNALNVKPSVPNDVNNVRSEISLLIKNLNTK